MQAAAFDLGDEARAFAAGAAGAGAVVTFTGVVRGDGGMAAMEIEHYPGMTEKAIAAIAAEAVARWSLVDALVIHRHGRLAVGEAIMMVATAAPHRAPFWKKEIGPDGAAWVAAKDADEAALTRW